MTPIAMVTGAAGDIGRAIALELARRGADVALSDVVSGNDDGGAAVRDVLKQIESLGRRQRYDLIDTTDPVGLQRWMDDVAGCWGAIPDWIIPNAAAVIPAPIGELTPEQWRRTLSVNLDGAFYFADAAARRLVAAHRPGRIIFIGSQAAGLVTPSIPAYCVSKAGLRMLVRCMALALAPQGILVNEIAPGNVDAGLSRRMFDATPGLREQCIAASPLPLLVEAEDVARQVAYLCGPDADKITGATLLIDAGYSLKQGSA
jgi:glucose 1-dehydrogenase